MVLRPGRYRFFSTALFQRNGSGYFCLCVTLIRGRSRSWVIQRYFCLAVGFQERKKESDGYTGYFETRGQWDEISAGNVILCRKKLAIKLYLFRERFFVENSLLLVQDEVKEVFY